MTNAELIQQFCRVYDEILRRERAGLMTDDDWLDPAQALREQSRAWPIAGGFPFATIEVGEADGISGTVTLADKIDPVAIYAAFVSTIVLIWQIFVWSGPRLRIHAGSNRVTIPDDGEKYIIAEVENVGTQQTTISRNRFWNREGSGLDSPSRSAQSVKIQG
jgi:hypothetical protein